ncbi:MAG TPA: flavin reductase family protein [Mycobacteriales bacterium]|jgi:flavin reductase (DIM6/NTAB) family NADH-FMN oxidoreductase RutF|nr:flavin reductase family protein [Mycobacteriales bacterium]
MDLDAAAFTLGGLRMYPLAVTTRSGDTANGLIALSGGSGSIVADAPRAMIGLSKYNLTHDLVMSSGVFAMHLLAADPPEALDASLSIVMALGASSGRDGDKLSTLATKDGVTGSPILIDALAYVEGRVVNSMDCDENTVFLADVVAAERLRDGHRLNVGDAWKALPSEWLEKYERNHAPQAADARQRRGLEA